MVGRLLKKNVFKKWRKLKQTTQRLTSETFLLWVFLIWTNIVQCLWIKMIVSGYLFKDFAPQTLLSCDAAARQWTWASVVAYMERMRCNQWRANMITMCHPGTGPDTQLWLFHNSSDLSREIKQQSLSRAFNPSTLWVKMSTICQLHLMLNLSRLLTNTYTVKWQRTKEVWGEAGQREEK